MNPATITVATEADLSSLLDMILELARFERLEHEVTCTIESLREALFGERPVAGALLARLDGGTVGYAIYYRTFSSFVGRAGIFLEDLYVRPTFRQRGIGRALVESVARIGAAQNAGRYEWIALRWNETGLRFYKRLGARLLDDWVMLRMGSAELRQLALGGGRPA